MPAHPDKNIGQSPLPRPPRKKKTVVKPAGKTPVTKTVGGREVGIGGLRRQRNIDDIVDEAQSGRKN